MQNPIKRIKPRFKIKEETKLMQGLIFNRVCLIIMVAIPLSLIVNAFTKLPYVSEVLMGCFVATGALYYNSRVLGNLRTSVIIFAVILHGALILNYIFNSGVEGPSLILFLVSLIFIIAVMPNKYYLFWVPLNLSIAAVLISLDYAYPDFIENSYHSRRGMFTDTAFTYGVAMSCIAFVLTFILRSYQKERNKAILAVDALEEANETKTKLLSILSHDLKAPLNSIQSFLEVLADYDLDEEEKTNIQARLLKETKNTQNMLANMLSWTKAQMEGSIRPEMVHVNLYDTLKVAVSIQKVAAGEKSITLENQIDRSLCVFADVEMIKLVVRNLLNNAVKFTKSGGTITISAKAKKGHGLITVSDNGIGIPADKQPEIFGLSTTASYGTANEKGVGLGLKLCKEFTALQGGDISFASSGTGTEFNIVLPLCSEHSLQRIEETMEPKLQVVN